jgi:hypothetical protein
MSMDSSLGFMVHDCARCAENGLSDEGYFSKCSSTNFTMA